MNSSGARVATAVYRVPRAAASGDMISPGRTRWRLPRPRAREGSRSTGETTGGRQKLCARARTALKTPPSP
jgi:hypothetical protein